MFPFEKLSRPVVHGLLVFAVGALLSLGVTGLLEQRQQQRTHNYAQVVAKDHAQALQQNLLRSLAPTQALASWVKLGKGQVPEFEALASDMLTRFPGVSAIALEPGGVIASIVPIQGNAKAIGLDLLSHSERAVEAKLARDSGQLTLAGPFDLVQGGLGALGFYPVFLDTDQGQRQFWGFTNVVLRLPQALGPAQLEQLSHQGYHYALWRIDPKNNQRQVIASSARSLGPDVVSAEVELPNARWTLSVVPVAGWSNSAMTWLQLALALLLSAVTGRLAWRYSLSRMHSDALAQKLDSSASDLADAQRDLQGILDALPDLLFVVDVQGRYLEVHATRTELLVAQADELLGKRVHDVMPKEAADRCVQALQQANDIGTSHGAQIELILPDGPHWFELSVARKTGQAGEAPTFVVLSRDITPRKRAELRAERLTRLYAALSQCNQAIVHCQDEQELFAIICRDAVNFGGMKLAWIGKPDATGQQVEPVAWFGEGADYLETVGVSLDPANPASHGPVGTAMREDHPSWCQDFMHDPATAPWHERARRYRWAAVASLPLKRKGQVVGAFSVYSDVANAFDDTVRDLLTEMAMDISYALDRMVDAQDRQRVQLQLRESEERYRKAFRTSPDSININRMADGLYLDVNEGFQRLTGWTFDETVGKTSAELNIWRDMADRQRLVQALRDEGRCVNLAADFVKKDGGIIHGLMSAEVISLNDVPCILSITRDVTEMRRAEAEIKRLAHFDQLTGLPNRTLLREHFEWMRNLTRRHHEQLAVMFLDLDHFKTVNDTLGHSTGDRLLTEVAQRLTSVLRAQDSLARLGGDEFILLLPTAEAEGAAQVAAKLIGTLESPCIIDNTELTTTVSIGIAMYPQDGQDFETLCKNADTAMYRVKRASRNAYCFFTQEMQAQSERTMHLVNAMRHALERHEFSLHYQPQVSLQDGRVIGAEALIRWHSPEFGALSPAEFIPIAEDSGQILEIGEWVIREAATQAMRWQRQGMAPITMSVNLSAVQFRHADLFDRVAGILHEVGLPPQSLEIELTEATAMDNPLAAVALMNRLNTLGVRMAIDDFGTGYSSLSYLKKFKVSKLKIDQSFVRDIGDDPDDKAIVAAIINMASSLGMHTIAEGVETASQLAYLREKGCDEVQGYYFSRPLPAAEFEAFMAKPLVISR